MAESSPRLLRSWQAAWHLSWRERWLLAQALVLLPLLGLALRLFGFRRLYGTLAQLASLPHGATADAAARLAQAHATAHLVQGAASHSPLRSTCLTHSLALWLLLRRQGIPSDLRIGVARAAEQFQAHAWVEHCGAVLNDAEDVRQRFAAFDHDATQAEVWCNRGAWTEGPSAGVPLGAEEKVLRFVQLCLRGRWEPEALADARLMAAQAELDWAELVRMVEEERLAPLLYHTVRGQELVPSAVEEALRAARLGNALRERLLRKEWAAILRRLAAQNVDVLLLKGAALAQTAYVGTGLRPMGDLDLLVRREAAGPAMGILAELGYQPASVEARPGIDLAYENEVMLAKAGPMHFAVELHWSLFDTPFHQQSLPMAWFWRTAQTIQVEGMPARVLGPEAQILHLCGHVVLHHGSGEATRLLWLHDVAEVLAHYREQIDWQELLDRAQACQLVLPVQQVLRRVADEWGGPIPVEWLSRLGALRPSAQEVRVVAWRTASQRPVAQRFWSDLASMDDWSRRLQYAWIHLFPSAAYMQSRYHIPHPALLPLYYPYRWLLGLRSGLSLSGRG